jgi:hypothetical protein
MLVVLIAAVLIATIVEIQRLSRRLEAFRLKVMYFDEMEEFSRQQAALVRSDRMQITDSSRQMVPQEVVTEFCQRLQAYYADMKRRYERAASRPWEGEPVTPPVPVRPWDRPQNLTAHPPTPR